MQFETPPFGAAFSFVANAARGPSSRAGPRHPVPATVPFLSPRRDQRRDAAVACHVAPAGPASCGSRAPRAGGTAEAPPFPRAPARRSHDRKARQPAGDHALGVRPERERCQAAPRSGCMPGWPPPGGSGG